MFVFSLKRILIEDLFYISFFISLTIIIYIPNKSNNLVLKKFCIYSVF